MNPGQNLLRNMQQQQQRHMREMQMAAWHRQKQEEKRRQADQQKRPGAPAAQTRRVAEGHFQVDERFQAVEAELARINQQFAGGQISEEELNTRMHSLMLQDDQGKWWMVGAATGAWFYYDGQEWRQSDAPGQWVASPADAQCGGHFSATGSIQGEPTRRPFMAVLSMLALAVVFLFSGAFVSTMLYRSFRSDTSPFVAVTIIFIIGLVVVIRVGRRLWRGY